MEFYEIANELDAVLRESHPSPEKIKVVIDKLQYPGVESYFFDQVTGLVWFNFLKEKGYFLASHNPHPRETKETGSYTIPSWPALRYLERISKACARPENRNYAEELMQIIREVTKPKDTEKADNYRTWWYFTQILSNLPTDVIKLEDIDLVSDWLDSHFSTALVDEELGRSLLPKFLNSPADEDWKKAAKLVEIVTRIRWIERKIGENTKKEPATAMGEHWLGELFKANATRLGEKCGNDVITILKSRLEEVLKSKKDDRYSDIWRSAIEDQSIGEDVKNILVSGLRDILLAYARKAGKEEIETVRGLFAQPLLTIKRVALYVINELYHIHGKLFWEVLHADLFIVHPQHELFELIKRHFRNFSPKQQNRVIDVIALLTRDWTDKTQKNVLDAQVRLDWLLAIKGQGNDRADTLYQEYLQSTKYDPSEASEFNSDNDDSSFRRASPISTEDLLNAELPEIMRLLNTFEESGKWKEPTEEGLANVLQVAIEHEPEKFQNGLSLFVNTKPSYQSAILRGFEKLWNDRKPINWDTVLKFSLSIVESETFWQQSDAYQRGKAPRSQVTIAISDLINAGAKSDDWAFEVIHLSIAEKIILKILEREPSTAKGKGSDALTEAINTPKGHCLEALMKFSHRQARLADKKMNEHRDFWEHIQPTFDRELEQCKNTNFEFSAIVGWYLPNLYVLSAAWVVSNIDKIFSVDYDTNWRCAMDGYSHVDWVYDEKIYCLLREHGHLKKGFETEFQNSLVRKKLIRDVSVAYLRGLESLSDEGSLFAEILQKWQAEDFSEIISLFWNNRDELKSKEKLCKLILEFWQWCYENLKDRERENASILSDLNLLTVFLTDISDEKKGWLMQSAPYAEDNYHSFRFLEYLNTLAEQNPEAIADVYVNILNRILPTNRGDAVYSIVEKLYKAGLKDKANFIANEYARKGYPDLLRDLYEQYN
jgi:hypothetical protein